MFKRRKKHQVRIRHQAPPSSKKKSIFYFILFSLILGGIFLFKQNKETVSSFKTAEEKQEKKAEPLQTKQKESSSINKKMEEQIQRDYRSNLLKLRMAEDSVLHQKNKFVIEKQSAEAKGDYSIKDGINLAQDESFDKLLDILKGAETDTNEDIEDRIARYRIIEEKIQNAKTQVSPDHGVDPRKAFAKEFIANARKGGYEVQLDDNFKVKSVKKVHSDPYEEALFIDENN